KYASDATCGDVRDMVDAKIDDIDRKIAALQAMRAELSVLFDECPGGEHPTDECPILESFAQDTSGVYASDDDATN
ncbi:MAG: MerR family DNA-binding protein, partial [Anaerolineae bacterium]|nr:MerR family DNA-binding protein [Anaerolineae bacterium]